MRTDTRCAVVRRMAGEISQVNGMGRCVMALRRDSSPSAEFNEVICKGDRFQT